MVKLKTEIGEGLVKVLADAHGETWSAYQADCVDFTRQMPENSVHLSIYSPPFANLYIYGDSVSDMGNCDDDKEFFEQYKFLVQQMHRITKPGRVSCVHCKNLVNYKGRDGMAGLRDFRGDIIRLHTDAGFAYHSEVVIWKDPVIEMQRTKAHGLLYKQLRADGTFSRQGMPEYILTFRKWADEEQDALFALESKIAKKALREPDATIRDEMLEEPEEPEDILEAITKSPSKPSGIIPVTHTRDGFPLEQWQRWASPVWTDIRQTNVLNCKEARDGNDEKHICPLQLDVIERCCVLWSNEGETIFSPFMGIGSEGYQAIKYRRKFLGTELKKSYFDSAVAYLTRAQAESATLFDGMML